MQRFGSGDAGAGVQFGTVAEGAFTATTLPNLAMSVPLAELRLHHQRRERADAAGARAKATGGLLAPFGDGLGKFMTTPQCIDCWRGLPTYLGCNIDHNFTSPAGRLMSRVIIYFDPCAGYQDTPLT